MAAPHNKFTDEQMAELRVNRYVHKIGRSFVYFNEDFKRRFWRMYMEDGLLPHEILRELGVNYRSLGQKRVQGIVQNLKKKFERELKVEVHTPTKKERMAAQTPERQLAKLKAEVEYLRQENEFLKKIASAGKEGRR